VAAVVGLVAQGLSRDEIAGLYPDLDSQDIAEALQFAAAAVREHEIPMLVPA